MEARVVGKAAVARVEAMVEVRVAVRAAATAVAMVDDYRHRKLAKRIV